MQRQNKLSTIWVFLAAFGLAITSPADLVAEDNVAEDNKDKVIATIDAVTITERELALAEVDLLQQYRETPPEKRRAKILNALIDIKAMSLAAEAVGIADEPNIKARLAFNRARQLHNRFFQREVLEKISDEEIRERFDIEIKNFPVTREIKARHILVESEEEAKAIIASLNDGADFVELAKEKSTGPSGPNGGDLGFFAKGEMVIEFETAVFALEEKGAYTKTPVMSQFGWHVIMKEGERNRPAPVFEDTQDQIRQVLAQEKYFQLTRKVRKNYEIKIVDGALVDTKLKDLLKE